jgi:hypothetical protein
MTRCEKRAHNRSAGPQPEKNAPFTRTIHPKLQPYFITFVNCSDRVESLSPNWMVFHRVWAPHDGGFVPSSCASSVHGSLQRALRGALGGSLCGGRHHRRRCSVDLRGHKVGGGGVGAGLMALYTTQERECSLHTRTLTNTLAPVVSHTLAVSRTHAPPPPLNSTLTCTPSPPCTCIHHCDTSCPGPGAARSATTYTRLGASTGGAYDTNLDCSVTLSPTDSQHVVVHWTVHLPRAGGPACGWDGRYCAGA